MDNNQNEQHQADETCALNFEFRGDGFEYFKIWIVNVLLSIATLGIYSAWAKVRNNRYFYSNLYLDGNNFRYLAEPLTILKGRIVAVVAFIAYSVIAHMYPSVAVLLALALFFAIPFFVNQSLAFNHRMSAYKNIQFRFHGDYWEAFLVLYVWPLLGMLTLGIMYPYALLQLNRYMIKNSAYGTSRFDFTATHKDYAMLFLTLLGVGTVLGLIVLAISTLLPSLNSLVPLLAITIYFGLLVYFIATSTNLYYCNSILNKHQLNAQLEVLGLAKVMLTNLLLIIVTFGLYAPAAKVRMSKYMAANISLHADGPLDSFAAAEQQNINALGEEFGQVFDFGV